MFIFKGRSMSKFIISNVISMCIGIAVGNLVAHLPNNKLKVGDCVKKSGMTAIGVVSLIGKDTVEIHYEMGNGQFIPDVANIDSLMRVECK